MVPEAPQQDTEQGRVAQGDGWFVANARDVRWYHAEGRSAFCDFEGDQEWAQVGVNLQVLWPGQPMSMYHWEADQEDFLVVSGEALLLVEGEERPLRAWDFVHCPPGARHTIVGAGDGPCAVVCIGARERSVDSPDWGGYPVDEMAQRHGAGVLKETSDPDEAYAGLAEHAFTAYREGWLPG